MNKEQLKMGNHTYYIDAVIKHKNLLQIILSDFNELEKFIEDINQNTTIDLINRGGIICTKYSDFTTVYKTDNNLLTLSNDGSVYVEPEIPEEPPVKPYVPTLEDIKQFKIGELSTICNSSIVDGVDIVINGQTEHFSYKMEDQTNIKNALDLAMQTNLDVPYHQNEGSCKLYSPEQIINLYVLQQTNLTHHQTYFNQLKLYIKTLEKIDEVKAINYGQELNGEYLENYNTIMNQANLIIKTVLNTNVNEGGN